MAHARIVLFSILAMSAMRVAPGADAAAHQESVGAMGVATLLEFMQITADGCSEAAPNLAADFDAQMSALRPRIRSMGDGLLLSEEFKDLRDKAAPVSLVEMLRKDVQTRKRLEALGPVGSRTNLCLSKLKELRNMNDATLVKEVANSLWLMRVYLKDIEQRDVQ